MQIISQILEGKSVEFYVYSILILLIKMNHGLARVTTVIIIGEPESLQKYDNHFHIIELIY